jgi:hypothetical protein
MWCYRPVPKQVTFGTEQERALVFDDMPGTGPSLRPKSRQATPAAHERPIAYETIVSL